MSKKGIRDLVWILREDAAAQEQVYLNDRDGDTEARIAAQEALVANRRERALADRLVKGQRANFNRSDEEAAWDALEDLGGDHELSEPRVQSALQEAQSLDLLKKKVRNLQRMTQEAVLGEIESLRHGEGPVLGFVKGKHDRPVKEL